MLLDVHDDLVALSEPKVWAQRLEAPVVERLPEGFPVLDDLVRVLSTELVHLKGGDGEAWEPVDVCVAQGAGED